ncbi:hypothetical protein P9139_04535 [Curtobacterium flaccumfaciens]|nr:hypothetical protein P9139_04535 [Curtobacterium flaccumfaciens]
MTDNIVVLIISIPAGAKFRPWNGSKQASTNENRSTNMDQPAIEGHLYCPKTDALAEALNEYASTAWRKQYHRDRNEQETRNARLASKPFRLVVKDEGESEPVPRRGQRAAVHCPLKNKP